MSDHPSLIEFRPTDIEPRVVPFSDVVEMLTERRRLWARIEKAEAEIERLQKLLDKARSCDDRN